MIRSIILCALFLGVANAARQIVVNPSPPPPGPTTADVPGALVSIVAPGASSATWTAAQSAALCAGLVANYTSLYPKPYINCEVKGVVDTAAHPAASVQTWMWWSQFSGMTDADKVSATQSRDLFVNTLYNSPNDINVLGKTVNVNDTCNAAWIGSTGSPTAQYSSLYTNIPNMPYAQCRIGIRGSATAETYTGGKCEGITMDESLCFQTAALKGTTVGAYGIDNGKTCPAGGVGAITQVTPVASAMYGSVTGLTATATNSGSVVSLVLTGAATSGSLLTTSGSVTAGQSFVQLGGVLSSGITGATGCTAAQVATYLNSNPVLVSAFTAGATTSASITLQFDAAAMGCTSGTPSFAAGAFPVATTIAPAWSPYCDTTDSFYQNYATGLAASGISGSQNFAACPRCGGATIATASRFTYSAANNNAGKACRSGAYPLAEGVTGIPADVQTAGKQGSSCIAVGVANIGVSNVDNAKPMLTTAAPYPYNANQYAFPSSATSCVNSAQNCAPNGNFPSGSVVPYAAGSDASSNTYFQEMAIDTEFGVPCSTPTLRPPIAGLITPTGIVGNYYLQDATANAAAARGSGTCNTQSLWWNGGTGLGTGKNNIVSYSSVMADLPTTFLANIEGPIVPPKPTPPAKPPTTPVPTPPTPTICTYKGTYEISPMNGPCDKYFLASGTTSDCSYNLVTLRTKSQLGNKMARIRWALATVAEKGVSTPTNVVAEARVAAKGTCTNRNLAAPSDPTTLKVGGSSWQWQFVPYPGSDKCDHVNMISQNRLDTTAFLEVPRTCDRFRYNATDGGRQRFTMKKV